MVISETMIRSLKKSLFMPFVWHLFRALYLKIISFSSAFFAISLSPFLSFSFLPSFSHNYSHKAHIKTMFYYEINKIHTDINIHTYIHTYTYIHAYIHTYIHIHTYTYIHIHLHTETIHMHTSQTCVLYECMDTRGTCGGGSTSLLRFRDGNRSPSLFNCITAPGASFFIRSSSFFLSSRLALSSLASRETPPSAAVRDTGLNSPSFTGASSSVGSQKPAGEEDQRGNGEEDKGYDLKISNNVEQSESI